MSGIYIHIPYCKQKCHYCNFYSFASSQYREVFVDALLDELAQRATYLEDKSIQTIYFGGGTPSILCVEEINRIIAEIDKYFETANNVEITLEANPDDLDENKLKQFKNYTAINRLSIGVQSFFDEDLKYLNRVHDSKQARQCIDLALSNGFQNLSIDMIYGIPTLSNENWKRNLEIFFSCDLPHLSSYALTIEPGTALNILIRKGKMKPVDEEQSLAHFDILMKETNKHGYVHYEISNFAKRGFYSKHNSHYWLGGHYLGIGPSAHSFNGFSRQWNVSNMKQYIDSAKVDRVISEKEILSKDQQFNEYVMTSLRTSWGIDTEHIENVFGADYTSHFVNNTARFIKEGKVKKRGGIYLLTNKGKLFADGIAAALFY